MPHGLTYTVAELEHAIRLVEQTVDNGNNLARVALVEIDPICTFDSGSGQCKQALEAVVVIDNDKPIGAGKVDLAAYCRRHAELARKAIEVVREKRRTEADRKIQA
jgi:hypothetical protein